MQNGSNPVAFTKFKGDYIVLNRSHDVLNRSHYEWYPLSIFPTLKYELKKRLHYDNRDRFPNSNCSLVSVICDQNDESKMFVILCHRGMDNFVLWTLSPSAEPISNKVEVPIKNEIGFISSFFDDR